MFFHQINSGFESEKLEVKKGVYTANIPDTLLDLIKAKIEKMESESLEKTIAKICGEAQEVFSLYQKEYDRFLDTAKDEVQKAFLKNFISSFIDTIDKPLENLGFTDENGKYQIESDITETLFSEFEDKITAIFQEYFIRQEVDKLEENLKTYITLPEIQGQLILFFEQLIVSDAFNDIYQVYRNNQLLDKTEIYFYFYELSLNDDKFPIFYIPLAVEKEENKFVLNFDQRVFVNTKSIDFALQNFNALTQNNSTVTAELERILYLSSDSVFKADYLQTIKRIENLFSFKNGLNPEQSKFQKVEHLVASLSNRCYLYLFDKSDEALINDYEEILNDKGELFEEFSNLVDSFIEENPKSFIEIVNDEWDEKEIPKKLVFESPVPLNDEQKQVLLALQKNNCKYMILEGPPGTGKSHTITAVICKALLEEKSVLVLSDKKEALDVVEDKITETLNKVRHGDQFQNPILRLGKSGNKFYKIVQGQTIQNIKDHYRSYKNHKSESDTVRKKALSDIEENIKENIDHFGSIDLSLIRYYVKNFEKFSVIDWIQNEDIEKLKQDLPRVKRSVKEIKKFSNFPFKASFITLRLFQNLFELYEKLQKLEESKVSIPNIASYQKLISKLEKDPQQSRFSVLNSLTKIKDVYSDIKGKFENLNISSFKEVADTITLRKLSEIIALYLEAKVLSDDAKKFAGEDNNYSGILEHLLPPADVALKDVIEAYENYISQLKEIKNPVLGYLFKSEKVFNVTRNFKKTFHYFNLEKPHKNIKGLTQIYDVYEFIAGKIAANDETNELFINSIEIFAVDCDPASEIADKLKSSFQLISESISDLDSEYLDLTLQEIDTVAVIVDIVNQVESILSIYSKVENFNIDIDLTRANVTFESLKEELSYLGNLSSQIKKILEIESDIQFLQDFKSQFPSVADRISLNIDSDNLDSLKCDLLNYSDEFLSEYLIFKEREFCLRKKFGHPPQDIFNEAIYEVEDLVTAEMTYFLDKRITEYTDNYAGEVNTLKNIIKNKKKFPKPLFKNLKKAFPCILAGIRDYAEYIPLEKELFDLIIIDEASQVSVAQALPALIRGRQVIVLGDDKQFSNVKSNNASSATNQQFKSKIKDVFCQEKGVSITNDSYGWLTKVDENFDIKNSILKFMRFIRNYECQLRKHFRCYPEIISYSNKYFYNENLQCMKIRGKPIEEVLKLDVIEHDGKFDQAKNTNEIEVDFIISKLKEFKEKGIEQSLGIITPHPHQVSLLFDKINNLPIRDWLFNKCRLKIMTFDTCQGEERDYIFYSMVATREKDHLNYIFLKDFSTQNDEDDGSIKAQRLNVGFSRAKECVHFVLSKQPEEFSGELKNALLYYRDELEQAKKKAFGKTDPNSPMEYKIEHYFYETQFYKENKDEIEFIPQFPLGDYLRQLDKTYNHPSYKVDFLLIYKKKKIIIEYDGFKEHFVDLDEVNDSNYQAYMKPDDIYRQKVLEGYGYKFLRINRFNIGSDPVQTLNDRLIKLVKKKAKNSSFLEKIRNKIIRLKEGTDRACDHCGKIQETKYFPDFGFGTP